MSVDSVNKDCVLIIITYGTNILAVLVEGDSFNSSRVSFLIELGDSLAVRGLPNTDNGDFSHLASDDEGSVVVDRKGCDIIIVAESALGITTSEKLLSVIVFVQDNTESGSHINDLVGISSVET